MQDVRSCYCLDDYMSSEISSLIFQVNKQVNLGLLGIEHHLSYMKPDNFTFTLTFGYLQ